MRVYVCVWIFQNHREVDKISKGASAAVRVDDANGGSTLTYGRQFSADSGSLYSSITRETINALKAHFRDQVCCGCFVDIVGKQLRVLL